MATLASSSSRGRRFASPEVRELVMARLGHLGGLVFAIAALLLALALASYNPHDPSLNTATSQPATNLAGVPGAMAADVLIQGFGVAAALPALAMLAWGYRTATRRPLRLILRVLCTVLALPLLAAVLSVAPGPAWPTHAGLGRRSGPHDRRPGRPDGTGAARPGGRRPGARDRSGLGAHSVGAGPGPVRRGMACGRSGSGGRGPRDGAGRRACGRAAGPHGRGHCQRRAGGRPAVPAHDAAVARTRSSATASRAPHRRAAYQRLRSPPRFGVRRPARPVPSRSRPNAQWTARLPSSPS